MSAKAQVRRPSLLSRLFAGFARIEDGAIIRFAFFAMLAGTASVLYVDYSELTAGEIPTFATPALPMLPPIDPSIAPAFGPAPELTTDWSALQEPLSVTLAAGGVLQLTGTIDVGAFDRFLAEVEARGEYVKTVALDSPGGSVEDAIAIGALIRERGYSTSVSAGALCASSCPLVLAAGVERFANTQSAIGVHQIYAAADAANLSAVADATLAMFEAQRTTALIARHLAEMGVDAELWLHALETPPQNLYYLTPEEMTGLKLITALQS